MAAKPGERTAMIESNRIVRSAVMSQVCSLYTRHGSRARKLSPGDELKVQVDAAPLIFPQIFERIFGFKCKSDNTSDLSILLPRVMPALREFLPGQAARCFVMKIVTLQKSIQSEMKSACLDQEAYI